MALGAGARLGPYEILAPLGSGGMGEVYKARDTRLERVVAVKVLATAFADDLQFRQRFDHEARAISALDHPHICALYDVGEAPSPESTSGGPEVVRFLVMQYLEGETLAERLKKGAVPLDQCVQYASQIADALDKAHRAGIVHRDLKPGNVMLTKGGAKLLDFGLAKMSAAAAPGAGLSMVPTTPAGLTVQGTILGTFQYMAPEQLEGQEADTRTDIFAFGALLYEMVTGRKAFEGKSHASLISSIMSTNPPPLSSVQPVAPQVLDRIVSTCLAKSPDDRFQTAHDLLLQLRWVAEGSGGASAARSGRSVWGRLAPIAAGVFLLTTIGLAARLVLAPRSDGASATMVSASVLPPTRTAARLFSISPDGTQVLFLGPGVEEGPNLWIRSIDRPEAQPLKGTERSFGLVWAPDGRRIAFVSDGKLKTMRLPDGSPQSICDTQNLMGGSWNRDGVILFVRSWGEPVMRVSDGGGTPSAVTRVDAAKQAVHLYPHFLPDGRHFLYFVRSPERDIQGVYVGSLDSLQSVRLLGADSQAVYAAPGYLLFAREEALLAQPFDASAQRLTGEAVTLVPRVQMNQDNDVASFSVSDNGRLLYRTPTPFRSELSWIDRAGRADRGVPVDGEEDIALSPDERRVAVTRRGAQAGASEGDVWLVDLGRGTSSRFTTNPRSDVKGIWSPDGSRLVFSSDQGTAKFYDLYEKPANGGSEVLLLRSDHDKVALDWSRDGRTLLFQTEDTPTSTDLWVFSVADKKATPFAQTVATERDGRFSPDGRWVAYMSNESGPFEVYVQPFPATGAKWQVSVGGGGQPRWAADGQTLFYGTTPSAGVRRLMSVALSYRPEFEAKAPTPVTELDRVTDYEVSHDGRRFLVNRIVSDPGLEPVTMILNWPALLKK